MVWVRKRTIPTERPPLVGEVNANFLRIEVPRGQRHGSLRPYSRFSRQEPLLFYQVAPQLYSRGWVDPVPYPLFFLVVPRIEPGPPDLYPRTLTTRPQRRSGEIPRERKSVMRLLTEWLQFGATGWTMGGREVGCGIPSTLKMEATRSSETSVYIKPTWCHPRRLYSSKAILIHQLRSGVEIVRSLCIREIELS
jgi:hypothetical protein